MNKKPKLACSDKILDIKHKRDSQVVQAQRLNDRIHLTPKSQAQTTMNAPQAFVSKEDIGHYVDGKIINPTNGRFSDVYNPATGSVSRRVALASKKEVDEVVAVAQKAFDSWSQTSPLRRARILFKYLELLNANRDALAAIITAEHGKVFTDAQGEVTRGIEI